jgi:hypothetical protein
VHVAETPNPSAAVRGKARSGVGSRGAALVVVLLAALVVLSPLLQPGYFWGAHDARHDAYFIFQYNLSAQEGIWFPRWSPDWTFGYGYPFFIVYGPLATFLGVLFHQLLSLGYEESVKAVLGFSVILSGLGMYGFARSWLGRWAGVVAAVAYMAIPYHLVDLYVRAAMAESFGVALLPLALWGFRSAVLRPRLVSILAAGAAYALIMWTSNLVALLFTPALALYVLLLLSQRLADLPATTGRSRIARLTSAIWPPGLALAIGMGLSAAFFIPALLEQQYINQTQWFGEYYDPAQHFIFFHQLFHPAWGYGISQPGPDDTVQSALSFQLGAAAALFSLISLAVSRRYARVLRRELWFWGLWLIVAVFLSLGISALAWRHVPVVPYAQFPWRYLMLAIIPLSILPAALVTHPQPEVHPQEGNDLVWPGVLLGGLLLLSSYPFLKVEMREPTPEQGPVSMAALMRFQRTSDEMTGVTAWVDSQLRPMWSDMAELWVQGKDVTTRVDYSSVPQNERLAVNAEGVGTAHEQIWYHAGERGQTITFNRFWYPGWTAWLLDGKDGRRLQKLDVVSEDGPLARVVVQVPEGEGYVLLRFEDTPLRAVAKWISVGTAALCGAWWLGATLARRRERTR